MCLNHVGGKNRREKKFDPGYWIKFLEPPCPFPSWYRWVLPYHFPMQLYLLILTTLIQLQACPMPLNLSFRLFPSKMCHPVFQQSIVAADLRLSVAYRLRGAPRNRMETLRLILWIDGWPLTAVFTEGKFIFLVHCSLAY